MSEADPALADDLALACAAARVAADVAVARFGGDLDVREKGSPLRPATDADDDAEAAVVELLARERPGDGVLGEEGGEVAGTARRWIVDPIDGTVNYVAGAPAWCVAVALEDAQGPRVAAVLDPLRGELFGAARGRGATLEGAGALAVRTSRRLREALVHVYTDVEHGTIAGVPETLARLAGAAGSLRMLGSGTLALAWVAAGRLDASVLPDPAAWDRVPGSLLVAEAGGASGTVDGALRWHVAGAPALLDELRGVLAPTRARA